MGGTRVTLDQVDHPVDARSAEVGHVSRRLAEREFHEPCRDLVNIDRLKAKSRRHRRHRKLGQSLGGDEKELEELRGAERGPWQAGLGDDSLCVPLVAEVEEREATKADNRDAVRADD